MFPERQLGLPYWYGCDVECRRGRPGRCISFTNDPRHDAGGTARLDGPTGDKSCPECGVFDVFLEGQNALDVFLAAFLELGGNPPFHAPDGQGNRDGGLLEVVARLLGKRAHARLIDGSELRDLFRVLDAKDLEGFQAFGLRPLSVLFGEPKISL